MLIVDLRSLHVTNGIRNQMHQDVQKIIRSACEDPSSSLLTLVPYQHLLWAAEANIGATLCSRSNHVLSFSRFRRHDRRRGRDT